MSDGNGKALEQADSPRKDLSDNELAIMKTLWKEGEATGRTIFDEFPRRLAYTTILTYLKRLEVKGYVQVKKEGRVNHYVAAVSKAEVVDRLLGRLIGLVDNEFSTLLSHHLNKRKHNSDDLAKILRLAKQALEKGGHRVKR